MRSSFCEKEWVVIAALHRGSLSDDLFLHAESCPICNESLMTAEALKDEAASLETKLRPPDPAVILCRAQQRAREQALARATWPIRVPLACTAVITVVSTPWIFAYVMRLPWILPFFKSLSFREGNWFAPLSGITPVVMAATLICIALSSWFVLREE
jgi:hypothetical protein